MKTFGKTNRGLFVTLGVNGVRRLELESMAGAFGGVKSKCLICVYSVHKNGGILWHEAYLFFELQFESILESVFCPSGDIILSLACGYCST
jgi:hypothetical protein